jgi:hypothetical protein
VYEISGPFKQPAGGAAASPFGIPAGERRSGPLRDENPQVRVKTARRIKNRALRRRGLVFELRAPAGARVSAVLDTADAFRHPGPGGTAHRPHTVTLARRNLLGSRRPKRVRMRLGRRARLRLARRRRPLTARLRVTAVMPSGRRLSAVRRIRVI